MNARILTIAAAAIIAAGAYAEEPAKRLSQDEYAEYQDLKSRHTLTGYKGFVEIGYSFDACDPWKDDYGNFYRKSDSFSVTTTHGYQINNYLFMGLGLGFERLTRIGVEQMPVFADFRINFLNDKPVTPFFDSKFGWSVGRMEGHRISLQLGARFRVTKRQAIFAAFEFIDMNYYNKGNDIFKFGFKTGFEF